MSEALRAEGYDVVSASSGREAMNCLGAQAPDLMLLDLKLADIDGPTLLGRLQRGESRVPFIIVTGQGDEKVAVEVMKRGALDYLIKSTALLDLLPEVVKRTLEGISQKKALASAQTEVLAAGERERLSIGADLHDGLGQQLTAIEFMCAAMREDTADTNPALARRLQQMCAMLREAVAQTRLLAHGLVPLGRSPDALQTGLAELAARTNDLGGLRCRFECREPVLMSDPTVAGHLYRIAQEATNNAIKHARADRVTIRLEQRGANLRLEVADNGNGLLKAPGDRQGLGLRVMRDRASLIGAELSVGSTRGKGVTIVCTRPIKE